MSNVFASTTSLRTTAANATFDGLPQPTKILMQCCELDYDRKRLGDSIMRGTATVFALILALAANAEQLDLEQFNEQWGTTMRECLADPERCDQEQLDKLWEAEIENDQREQWERWRSQCADNANPEQCLREKEEESESDLWEYALIFYWVADTLPVAETGAELKYRLRAISSVSMELGMAEFQLPPRARQIVESKLDRLEKLRAIDRTAAEAYRHKLLRGETLKERLQ